MIGIGFGTWAWGNQLLWGYRPGEWEDLILEKTFQKAVSGGLSLIDTADSYGTGFLNGRSESLLGQFIDQLPPRKREAIKIATKLAPYPWRLGKKGFQKAFIASQKRLKGHLNRVQLHWSTERYAPWQEGPLIDNLSYLVEEGYVKEIGVSNIGPDKLKLIYKKLKDRGVCLKSLQLQFSLLSPQDRLDSKTNIIDICKRLEIDFIAYSPLALGILTMPVGEEKVPSTILRKAIFNKVVPASQNLRQIVQKIAKDNSASSAQVALNWCRSHGALPIPGLRTPEQAEDAIKALKWSLNNKEKKLLDEASKECKIRMPINPFTSK